MTETIEYPNSMFENYFQPSYLMDEKSSFKKELASSAQNVLNIGNNIELNFKVLEGIVTISYHNSEIKSFQIVSPIECIAKENPKKGLVVLDFTSGPQILKSRINKKEVTLPVGFLRMLEPIEDMKEW